MPSFPKRFLLMVSIVIALTDLIGFWLHQKEQLAFVISVAIITIIPIAVILSYWVHKYKMKW